MTSASDALQLRHGRALPNRLALAPMTNLQSYPDGTLSDTEITWLEARARGGFGLVMTAAAFVHRAGQAWPGQLGVSSDKYLPELTRLADALRSAGAVSAVQLHHGGLRADAAASGLPLVGPWAEEDSGARALTTGEVYRVVEEFADAAARAERAGFDGVEVHGAHGYLLCQFLDAEHNLREDGYGGDAAGRARVIHEVVEAVRARTGPEFQLGLRLSPERFGVRLDEMVTLTTDVLASGRVDYLDLSLWDVRKRPEGAGEGVPRLLDHFLGLPRHGTALGVAGLVTGTEDVRELLDAGVDLVFVGKGAIADQAFARGVLGSASYRAPEFPVTRGHLRAQLLGEPFVEYFSTKWPHLVKG